MPPLTSTIPAELRDPGAQERQPRALRHQSLPADLLNLRLDECLSQGRNRVNEPLPENSPAFHVHFGVLLAAGVRIYGLRVHRRSDDARAVGSVLPALYGLHVHRLCGDVRAVGCSTRKPRPDIEGQLSKH